MSSLYNFPEAALFGKTVAKNKIFDNVKLGKRLKALFVEEVDKITWSYKLSPDTINLPPGDGVQEIQVFTTALRSEKFSIDVLHSIDKAIPSPILFELVYEDRIRYAAGYKRPSESAKSKWVVSGYFTSEWLKKDAPPTTLPVALNMGTLYRSLLTSLSPLPLRRGETLNELVKRVDQFGIKERKVEILESQIKKEKQFNRRVELNRNLIELRTEMAGLANR